MEVQFLDYDEVILMQDGQVFATTVIQPAIDKDLPAIDEDLPWFLQEQAE